MNWQPLGPSPFPLCRVLCCKCGKWEDSLHAAADLDGEPFVAYHCWQCQTPDVRAVVSRATDAAFMKLPAAIRDDVRQRLYGSTEARAIKAREQFNHNRGA